MLSLVRNAICWGSHTKSNQFLKWFQFWLVISTGWCICNKLSSAFHIALKLPFGKTTVMHLVARETLPEPNSQGEPCAREGSHSSHSHSGVAPRFSEILRGRSSHSLWWLVLSSQTKSACPLILLCVYVCILVWGRGEGGAGLWNL